MNVCLGAEIKLVSLDVFDTVLARRWPEPGDVFTAVGVALGASDPFAFRVLRAECELALRRGVGFRSEVRLADICRELAAQINSPEITPERLLSAELQTELDAIYPIPSTQRLIADLRNRGLRFAFTSDTYLPGDFIAKLLKDCDVLLEGDMLLVSSEIGRMKATGELFAELIERSGLLAHQIHHVGDNTESDLKRPRAAGLAASLVAPSVPRDGEASVVAEAPIVARLRGAMRSARLTMPAGLAARHAEIWSTSASVAAPMVAYFARWCAQQAKQRGIRRLYFMARDGQIVKRVAEISRCPSLRGLELRYLHVSRQALLLPALRVDALDAELDWILARTQVLTPRIALRRVAIDPEHMGALLENIGLPKYQWDSQLDSAGLEAMRRLLLGPGRQLVLERAAAARALALDYLHQEQLLENETYALVDVGWNGTLQRSIGRLLEASNRGRPTTGLYVGLRSYKKHREDDVMLGCFADVGRSAEFDRLGYLVPLIELFFSADHGGVTGYQRLGSRITPLLNAAGMHRLTAWGVDVQQQAILALERQLDGLERYGVLEEWKPLVLERLSKFAAAPTREQAAAYGCYEDAEDQNESYTRLLAASFGFVDALRFRGFKKLRHHNEWAAGSLAMTAPWLRWLAGAQRISFQRRARSQVFLNGLEPVEGFGPEEGPYSKLHLPRFVWAYGPQAVLRVPARSRPANLTMSLSTLFPDQHVEVEFNGQSLIKTRVPPGDAHGRHPSTTLACVLPAGGTSLAWLKSSFWATTDRPLALVVMRVSLEGTDAN